MRATKLTKAIPILAVILALPAWSAAQDVDTDDPAALIEQFEAGNGPIPPSVRENYQAFLERLRNANLRPAQKRRIYNAYVDGLRRRLRQANDRPNDVRPTEARPPVRPDVRPDVRPEVRPDVRPDVRPPLRPGPRPDVRPDVRPRPRPLPPQARRGLGVARAAAR